MIIIMYSNDNQHEEAFNFHGTIKQAYEYGQLLVNKKATDQQGNIYEGYEVDVRLFLCEQCRETYGIEDIDGKEDNIICVFCTEEPDFRR